MLVIWLKLLCFAGKTDNEGVFRFTKEIPYNEEMFASIFGENINTVRIALQTFIKFGMMEKIEGTYALTNWTKYQSETAAIERAKEKKHERQKRWRLTMYDLIDFISHYVQAHQAEYETWLSTQGGGEGNEAGGERVHHGGQFPLQHQAMADA
jgi:predicted phage replisome organizer